MPWNKVWEISRKTRSLIPSQSQLRKQQPMKLSQDKKSRGECRSCKRRCSLRSKGIKMLFSNHFRLAWLGSSLMQCSRLLIRFISQFLFMINITVINLRKFPNNRVSTIYKKYTKINSVAESRHQTSRVSKQVTKTANKSNLITITRISHKISL